MSYEKGDHAPILEELKNKNIIHYDAVEKLYSSVLETMFKDLQAWNREDFIQAKKFFFDVEDQAEFENVCLIAKMDPDYVREGAMIILDNQNESNK